MYVFRAVFPILIVNNFPSANPNKLSIFAIERLVTCRFSANCTHLLTRTEEKKFEDVFFVKITNKATITRCDLSATILFKLVDSNLIPVAP